MRTVKQHGTAMAIRIRKLAASSGSDSISCPPIAQALEKLSVGEMQSLCHLSTGKEYGMDIGQSYLNERSCRKFIHYTAEAK